MDMCSEPKVDLGSGFCRASGIWGSPCAITGIFKLADLHVNIREILPWFKLIEKQGHLNGPFMRSPVVIRRQVWAKGLEVDKAIN